MKRNLAFFIALSALSLSGYVVGVYLLCVIVERFPQVGPFVFIDTRGVSAFSLLSAIKLPAAFMGVTALCIAIDAACLGFGDSSLKRLLHPNPSASARVDLFYAVLRFGGGMNVLVFLFSFGTLIWVVNQIHRVLHTAVLERVDSFIGQFLLVFLINTFIAYWLHRLMHTRMMWELHKVHHAAEEMNIVTNFRSHPVEQVIATLANALPAALLGASPSVILTYSAISMVYGSLSHSELRHKSKWWDVIFITPAAHRIHHSNRLEHFDTNFGMITLWDYIFGTYYPPSNESLQYGIDDGARFNRPGRFREVFDNARRWLCPEKASRRSATPADASPQTPKPGHETDPQRGTDPHHGTDPLYLPTRPHSGSRKAG